jgi:hypothetical protein
MNTSMSLNTLRSSLAAEDQPYATSSPRYGGVQQSSAYSQQRHQSPAYQHFDRNGQSRNSISKRYLSHVGDSPETQTVWSPNGLKQRQNSSLFNPATPTRRRKCFAF